MSEGIQKILSSLLISAINSMLIAAGLFLVGFYLATGKFPPHKSDLIEAKQFLNETTDLSKKLYGMRLAKGKPLSPEEALKQKQLLLQELGINSDPIQSSEKMQQEKHIIQVPQHDTGLLERVQNLELSNNQLRSKVGRLEEELQALRARNIR